MRSLLLLLFFSLSLGIQAQEVSGPDTLVVGYTSAPPFIVLEEDRMHGVNVWLWDKVASELELPYRMELMDFNQMLDGLATGAVDVGINPLTITSDRSKAMEFTHSFFASNSTIVVGERGTLAKFLDFMKAFFNVDFLKGLFALVVIIFLFGMAGWYFERKDNPETFRKGYKGLWDGIWWSAVTLTTVGYGDKAPKSRNGKIIALLLMFGGLLFISGLTASIASNLTVNELSSNPTSFNAFKELQVGTVQNSGAEQFLKEHFFKDVRGYNGIVPGLQDLNKGKIDAFIYDEPILMHRLSEDESFEKLHLLPIQFDVQFYAFGVAKNHTELEQILSQKILEIIERREWEILLNEYALNEL